MRTIKLTKCNVYNFQTTKSYYLVQVLQANEVTSVRSDSYLNVYNFRMTATRLIQLDYICVS